MAGSTPPPAGDVTARRATLENRVTRPGTDVKPVVSGELLVLLFRQAVPLHRDRRGHQVPFPRADSDSVEVEEHDLAVVSEQVLGVGVTVDRAARRANSRCLYWLVRSARRSSRKSSIRSEDARTRGPGRSSAPVPCHHALELSGLPAAHREVTGPAG